MASERLGVAAGPAADAAGQASRVRPLAPAERIPALDVLRGIAILGVLTSYTLWNLGFPPPESWTRWIASSTPLRNC